MLLDRLLDADPGAIDAPPPSAAEALARLHAAVRRDLEALLNARRRRRRLPSHLAELRGSLLGYGLPDPASGAYALPEIRAGLVAEIESTIRRFEPRLGAVSVTLVDDGDVSGRTLRLTIDAVLHADAASAPVSFDTVIEQVTRDVTVRETRAP